jgi:hypothetical protein
LTAADSLLLFFPSSVSYYKPMIIPCDRQEEEEPTNAYQETGSSTTHPSLHHNQRTSKIGNQRIGRHCFQEPISDVRVVRVGMRHRRTWRLPSGGGSIWGSSGRGKGELIWPRCGGVGEEEGEGERKVNTMAGPSHILCRDLDGSCAGGGERSTEPRTPPFAEFP